MPLALLLAFLSVIPASALAAELTLEGELPFVSAELSEAVSLRVPSDAKVRVQASGADAVRVTAAGKMRTVALLGLSGRAAARRVALAIADLLEPDLNVPLSDLPPPAAPAVTATVAAIAPPPRVVAAPIFPEIEAAPPAPERGPLAITTLGVLGGPTRFSLGAAADASLSIVGPLRVFGGVGLSWTPPVTIDGAEVRTLGVPLRAGAAYRLESLELRAGALCKIHLLIADDSDGGGRDRSELLPGAGFSASYFVPFSRSFDGVVALGADLYLLRREFTVRGQTALATERFALWAAIGINFEAAR